MSLFEQVRRLVEAGERAVVFTVIQGEPLGAKLLVGDDGEVIAGDAPRELAEQTEQLIRSGHSRVLEVDGRRVFAEVLGPPPRLLVFGAVDTAEALCAAANAIGWTTIVADARAKFATADRLPSADEVIVAWPEEALARVQPDHTTAVVVLTHDDKFDIPALTGALATDACYIGALGSRRNQARRRERLVEAGVDEAQLDRIAGPCGLDIGADTPAETALSILAEILAVKAGRTGGPLREATTRIHVEREPETAPTP
ncbi:MAG TPA: XdhC/CoxI family protein [Gaiellaceae bacterium]